MPLLRCSPSENPPTLLHHEPHLRCLFVTIALTCSTLVLTFPPAAGQLIYTDPTTGVETTYNGGDIAWTLASTALVWLMVPGVGFFYSGLLRRKNALSLIYLSVAVLGIVSFEVRNFSGFLSSCRLTEPRFQWWFWGYSLAFSDGANGYIGDLKYFALRGVQGQPSIGSPRIPALVFCIYQCMFAAITYVSPGLSLDQRSDLVPSQPGHRHRCRRRTRPPWPHSPIHFHLVYHRLQPARLYDMELQRMVIRQGWSRLRRWNPSPHLLRYRRSCHLHLPWKAYRLWD